MKRKWNLLQVSDIDPNEDWGKDPAQDIKKFKKSAGTNIKARAIAELSDPNVIVTLGGSPQYIHSTEVYFRQGLDTAIKRMTLHLEALVQEQQARMRDLIARIDAEWKTKLSSAFGPDTFPTFADFKKFWDAQIVHNPNPNEFMRQMQDLVELKKLKTKIGAMEYKKEQVKKSLASGGRTALDEKKMQDALSMFGVSVSRVERGGKQVFRYGGNAVPWQRAEEEATQRIVDKLFDPNKGLLIHVSAAVDKVIDDFKEGKISKIKFDHAAIGSLFEALSEGYYTDIMKNPKTHEALDMSITRVAAELAQNEGRHNVKTFKADSKIELLAGDEVVLEFLVSDKTGQSLDWNQVSQTKSVDLKTRTIDQFTASINSATLDFSNFELENVQSFNNNKQEINSLINYVIANGFAFAGQVSVVQFKEILVLYAAWMKIISEVVGDEDIANTPLAVRTLSGLYSTADILQLFVNIAPRDMHTYLNNKMFASFYKSDSKLSNRLKNELFRSKKITMRHNQDTMSYEELKRSTYVSNNPAEAMSSIQNLLESINASVKKNWPAIKGSYLIKLNNLKSRR